MNHGFLKNINVILWDFDGVILDSMEVRDYGFRKIFEDHPSDKVEKLIQYHRENGGLSRYVKIRYFFNHILERSISDREINDLAKEFSEIMKIKLTDPSALITDSVDFIEENTDNYKYYIVSGSDQKELKYLCSELGISKYFIGIYGSPTSKTELVSSIISYNKFKRSEVCLIGDSINDYDAAKNNNILFLGYNNLNLKVTSNYYIDRLI